MYTFKAVNLPHEADALARFITCDTWPFHGNHGKKIDSEKLRSNFQKDNTTNVAYFWIVNQKSLTVGLIKLFDLDDISDDGYPMFDLRVLSKERGKGIGLKAVKWLCGYLFEKWPTLNYIQGSTREDNFAMRKVFLKSLFAKEAHIRQDWDGSHASILYGILREDWKSGKVTPVNWNDESHLLP